MCQHVIHSMHGHRTRWHCSQFYSVAVWPQSGLPLPCIPIPVTMLVATAMLFMLFICFYVCCLAKPNWIGYLWGLHNWKLFEDACRWWCGNKFPHAFRQESDWSKSLFILSAKHSCAAVHTTVTQSPAHCHRRWKYSFRGLLLFWSRDVKIVW